MEIVAFKGQLCKVSKIAEITAALIAKLNEKGINFQQLRFDLELTTYICNVVENEILDTPKEEKIRIIINIINSLYVLGDADREIITSQITYLINNKKIKKIGTMKYVYKSVGNWLSKKFS